MFELKSSPSTSQDIDSQCCKSAIFLKVINKGVSVLGVISSVSSAVPMTTGGRSVDVTVGDPLVLTVNITDFNLPLTEVTWEGVGGVTLTNTTPRVTIVTSDLQVDPASSTLTLDMVVSLMDQGQYRATAINPAGNTSTTFDVTVLGTQAIATS